MLICINVLLAYDRRMTLLIRFTVVLLQSVADWCQQRFSSASVENQNAKRAAADA